MAIRLRNINGVTVALCAARSVPKEGAQDSALRLKFKLDYNSEDDYNLPIGDYDLRSILLIQQEENNNPNRDEWELLYGTRSEGSE